MNKIFALLIICSLSLPCIAVEGNGSEQAFADINQTETLMTEDLSELSTGQQDINSAALPDTIPSSGFKEPIGKKKLAKKFIIAMLCVAGASVFLYGALSIYNKLRDILFSSKGSSAEGEQPLETPSDLTEAVKTFIDKTRWEN